MKIKIWILGNNLQDCETSALTKPCQQQKVREQQKVNQQRKVRKQQVVLQQQGVCQTCVMTKGGRIDTSSSSRYFLSIW